MIDPARLSECLARFPSQLAKLGADGAVEYLEAGSSDSTVSHVMLHGIGSSAASWVAQLDAAEQLSSKSHARALAWNAPGYGQSSALSDPQPLAHHYAARFWDWIDAMHIDKPFMLVGQSMGCLIAAAAAAMRPALVGRLVLFAPARGYGRASEEERIRRRDERLSALRELGPEGLAQKRGAAMLSSSAPTPMIDYVRDIMRRVHPGGYAQATHMLAQGDIDADLAKWRGPLVVASGSADTITPAAGCRGIAERAGTTWTDLGAVGHGCPLEASSAVNSILGLE